MTTRPTATGVDDERTNGRAGVAGEVAPSDGGGAGTRGLDVGEDLSFQRRAWRFQRVGWVVLAVILVVALLGGLGDGPLSDATRATGDGVLQVQYQRIERHRSPASVVVRVRTAAGDDTVRLWMDASFAHAQQFNTIHPEPESVATGGDRLVYEFAVAPGDTDVTVSFESQCEAIGPLRGEVGLVDGPSLSFRQFVMP